MVLEQRVTAMCAAKEGSLIDGLSYHPRKRVTALNVSQE